jgi:hypothetical protein
VARRQLLVGGADPGADYVGAASLAAQPLRRGRGYRRQDVEELRRRASNSVAHLEAEVEALRVQVGGLRRRLGTELGPEALARGAAWLARELRELFAGRDAERAWVGEELQTIVTASSDVLAHELVEAFPTRVAELVRGDGPPSRPASQLAQAVLGEEV